MKNNTGGFVFWKIWLLAFFGVLNFTALVHGGNSVVRFALQDRIGSVLPMVAVERDYFSKQGIPIKPFRFSSGPSCMEALYSGSVDIATMGDTTALILTAKNPDFVVIASHAQGEFRHRVMVKPDSPFNSLADLKGKRIGIRKGTSTHGGFLAALQAASLSGDAFMPMDLKPATMVDALMAGSLDAFAASEPTPSLAETRGARELTTFGGLGNQYPILILARREWVRENRDLAIGFLRALEDARTFQIKYPREAIALVSRQTGLDSKITREVMARHEYGLQLGPTVMGSLARTAAFLVDQGIINGVPDLNTITAPELLAQIH
ncbi:MAG: NrtA/SsuA/CpmA family ABC transporter substrate-binding protein [Desulfobacterales bacterium]|nr:NrtA/SsuA/CpmA family ABC transporter substrate-binding protein [Desulfobacterales bacterium]